MGVAGELGAPVRLFCVGQRLESFFISISDHVRVVIHIDEMEAFQCEAVNFLHAAEQRLASKLEMLVILLRFANYAEPNVVIVLVPINRAYWYHRILVNVT